MSTDNKVPVMKPGDAAPLDSKSVDEVRPADNERLLSGAASSVIFLMCVGYIVFHLYVLNIQPVEPWKFRLVHVSVGLLIGFLLFGSSSKFSTQETSSTFGKGVGGICLLLSSC